MERKNIFFSSLTEEKYVVPKHRKKNVVQVPPKATEIISAPPSLFIPPTEKEDHEEEKEPEPKKPKTVYEYSLENKNMQDILYMQRLEELGRISEIKPLPPLTEVLSYINHLKDKPPWYVQMQHDILNSKMLNFPAKTPILTREFILNHLYASPDKKDLCMNVNCESERLGGFRIRKLTIEENDWCYLCHLVYTNRLFLESKNRKPKNERCYQLHFFGVLVNVVGEYDFNYTLNAEKPVKGLFAPFPRYRTKNYVQTTNNLGLRGWIESDKMVFRLSQTTSSNPTKSCPPTPQATANFTTPSDLTISTKVDM